MSDEELVDNFVTSERSRIRTWRGSELVLRTYLKELQSRFLGARLLDSSEILALVSEIHKNNRETTKARFLCVLRQWYRYLYEEGQLLVPIQEKLFTKPLPNVLLPQVLTVEEVDEWFALCRVYGDSGLLDLAMFECAYGCGLRAGELFSLRLPDLDLGKANLVVRTSKNGEGRTLPVPSQTLEVLTEYLKSRHVVSRLWVRSSGSPISYKVLRNHILSRYRPLLKFGWKVSLKTLRHSYATHLLKNGASVVSIQKLLGHKSLQSTQVYTHVFPQELRSQIVSVHRINRELAGFEGENSCQ